MPKTPRTPVRPRPKPKSPASRSKKVTSSPFVDDEAEDSEDGVLVEAADAAGHQLPDDEPDNVARADYDDEYEQDFINDGDPFEDTVRRYPTLSPLSSPTKSLGSVRSGQRPAHSPEVSLSPPPSRIHRGWPSARSPPETPSPVKRESVSPARRGRDGHTLRSPPDTPSPSKRSKRPSASAGGDVIEVDDTSDEDLAAMDVDDSVFRKPAGVKASALPPSLLTRSAAAKKGIQPPALTVTGRVKTDEDAPDPASPAQDPPAIVDGVMNAAMIALVNGLLAQQTASSQPSGSRAARPLPKVKKRIDHDQQALEAGIAMSTGRKPPVRYSPDWDPPFVGDLLEDVKQSKAAESDSRAANSAKRKGKAKARAASKTPDHEDVVSDSAEDSSPKKKAHLAHKKKSLSGPSGVKVDKSDHSDQDEVNASGHPPGSLAGYLVKLGYPPISTAGLGDNDGDAPLTMAQFQRVTRGDLPSAADGVDDDKDDSAGSEVADTVFLEDIEVYRVYFDPKAKCGVFDIRLQALSLRPTYIGLHPLPANRRILAAYDRNRNSMDEVDMSTGGHINWESWYNQNPRMLAGNSVGAIVFVEAAPNFVNLSRVSPLRLNTRISAGSSSTYRLHVEDRVAICVSVICTTESHLVAPKRIGAKSERMRKWPSGVLHDQEWERFESSVCLQFHEQTMYSQITDKALSFQTMISPDPRNAPNSSPADQRSHRSVPSAMFSAASPKKSSGSKTTSTRAHSSTKTLLAYNDSVPIYDARRIVVNFNTDLGRLGEVLPLFPGEVPVGSYTVVGYALSSYMATLSGSSDRVPHVGCNILWAIVCGTPSVASRT